MDTKSGARRRGRPTKAEAEDIAKRLLERGWDAIVRDGYNGTSMEAIAVDAGVTKRTLYSYFPTKPAMFEAVFLHRLSAWNARSLPDPTPSRLKQRVESYCHMVVSQLREPDLAVAIKLVLTEAATFSEVGRVFDEKAFGLGHRTLVEFLTSASDIDDYQKDGLENFSRSILDAFWGWYSRLVITGNLPISDACASDIVSRCLALVAVVTPLRN